VGDRLIFVSNRLPITIEKRRGEFFFRQSVGGLATGLGSFYQSYDSEWVGWSGMTPDSVSAKDREVIETRLKEEYRNVPLFLSKTDIKNFYHGFCNKTIWPLFHYFPNYTVYEQKYWESYRKANELFLRTVEEIADPEDIFWVHDYQLMLLPALLRDRFPDARIGFFLHIPFPSFEIFRMLPWRREIAEGLLGADLIGFHTYDYVRHFLSSVRRILGYDHTFGQIVTSNRVSRVDAFPMGIDYERYSGASGNPEVKREIDRIRKKVGENRVILSVDRLDYTKGILQRLEAYDLFLRTNPRYRGKVLLILVAVPSRTGVESYMQLKKELDELIGKINGEHGTLGWVPVWYLYRYLPFHTLTALYWIADIALVTPIRDGMNLIAKEYIAAKRDRRGVLILSGMAGSVHEMGEALIVNPNNREQVAQAMGEALHMSEEEQVERNTPMHQRISRYNVIRWAQDFFDKLNTVTEYQKQFTAKRLTASIRRRIVSSYRSARRRLILLDYDGTLIPFATRPVKAVPDEELLDLLGLLVRDRENRVVIISERDRDTLDRWFGRLRLSVIAEHGVWTKERDGTWNKAESSRNDWKEEVRPVIENYMDRTPGAFIEEKEYSLAFHYRNADPDLAYVRVNELKETLFQLTENLNLGIVEGNKVVEIKNAEMNKGRAVQRWLAEDSWEFILAAGDDVTDEDMFATLPEGSFSVKVGLGLSQAEYMVVSSRDVRELLTNLLET
jgi:trehalose 6-phosphate synthase/phosphatase